MRFVQFLFFRHALEDVENYEQDSFEDYSGQLKLSFRKKCRDDENKFIVHKK